MSIYTNLQGRLRNTNLPKSHALLPVFETVVNSIHAIEERDIPIESGKILLKIQRNPQLSYETDSIDHKKDIDGFIVEDNGIGFNENNMKSFETLDSDHKIDKGCRGVGRLLWLKAFKRISIESVFLDSSRKSMKRTITFDSQNGVRSQLQENDTKSDVETHVFLNDFVSKYSSATPKSINPIANALLEHCLWYFVRKEGIPNIVVQDEEQSIYLNELFSQYIHESASEENIQIKKYDFHLTHIKFRSSSNKTHGLSFCAGSRLVREESIIGKIPGLYGKISDDNGDFIYSCYVSSSFLDEKVRSERTSFDIAENVEGFLTEFDVSLNDIRRSVLVKSTDYLKEYLEDNLNAGKERVDKYVAEKAPRYRPILSHIESDELTVDPKISDKELELHLHKQLVEVERKMLEQGHDIMSSEDENIEDYKKRLNEYLKTAEDIKKSDLANYVSHRRVILDLLEKSIQRTKTGKYVKEDLIHELIMPMGKDSNELLSDAYNLWLVDERLAFHNYLASDKTLNSMPITNSSSNKEPDVCALNVYDNPILVSEKQSLPLASITVIEIKRPMRNDAKAGEEKDPIEQALKYLDRIRNGKVRTASGRPIPNSENIPGYCYIICDLTDSIVGRCRYLDLTVSADHLGYFGFHKEYKAYIEVISYDKLVNAAKERNRAFFDKLGLPAT